VQRILENPIPTIQYWSPAVLTAGIAWVILLLIGDTPIVRASGLALVIMGVTATMRHMGYVASIGGGLTLAFCPIFWSQTGGGVSDPATIIIAIGVAILAALLVAFISQRPYIGIGLGIAAFVAIFWSQIGTSQSLRLTGFVTAWIFYLLVDMMLLTNPRPDAKGPQSPKPYHTIGILFLFIVGVVNDPLLTLLAPAIILSLFLSYANLPTWYWVVVLVAIGLGIVMLTNTYINREVPIVNLLGWRDAHRWIDLGQLIISQFSIFGVLLGVIGLARFSRWYPPLGTITMLAYAAYAFFGFVFDGNHRDILLIPLLIIQIMWMTYAVNALGQWVNKTLHGKNAIWTHLVSTSYLILPAILLWNIIQS
jgi:hypothetical protein